MDPLLRWRPEFPILSHTAYMISHSLGAMPARAAVRMLEFTSYLEVRRALTHWGLWNPKGPSDPADSGDFDFVTSALLNIQWALVPPDILVSHDNSAGGPKPDVATIDTNMESLRLTTLVGVDDTKRFHHLQPSVCLQHSLWPF